MKYLVDLKDVNLTDLDRVGGKNASLGEMIQKLAPLGVNVPGGFAITTQAFKDFLSQNDLDQRISKVLTTLKTTNIPHLNAVSARIRQWIISTPFIPAFEQELFQKLAAYNGNDAMAVRSSAVEEDLPTASFAGQQDSYLNVRGTKNILHCVKRVFASLFTSRAIAYRHHQDFHDHHFALSVGIQPMVRSDIGTSGVVFTLDTESGFDKVIFVTASYGLGEAIVMGEVNPDEFYLYKPLLEVNKFSILQRKLGNKGVKTVFSHGKPSTIKTKTIPVPEKDRDRFCLNDKDVEKLARYALLIEKHYGKPMDIEWAQDGKTGDIFIVQARPETVKSQDAKSNTIDRYVLPKKSKVVVSGQAVGQRIGAGVAKVLLNPKKIDAIRPGDVLVTDMTDPDWEPIIKNAAAIVTNRGGRTCHAAIIARELGIPAIVGCVDATKRIKNKSEITVSCAEGQTGQVYAGRLKYRVDKISVTDMPPIPVKIGMNIGNPDKAFAAQFLPNHGVGLARFEFIISDMIGIHPNAVLNYKKLPRPFKNQVMKKTAAYADPKEYYIERLREGISMIAAAFNPKQVIFRFSDFKTNEYANLLGGALYEPHEENPMLGYRGASRYKGKNFRAAFELECRAIKRTRDMGLTNAQVMIPFVRTVKELRDVIELIEQYGLKRGRDGLKVYMMCEIPSNALLADEFLEHVDGFSIGSNDMTQLVLGLDRDSTLVADSFDERDPAVKIILSHAINACNKHGKYSGICGQGPSDHPTFAQWLMRQGIQNISLNPDTIVETWMLLAQKEKAKATAECRED